MRAEFFVRAKKGKTMALARMRIDIERTLREAFGKQNLPPEKADIRSMPAVNTRLNARS